MPTQENINRNRRAQTELISGDNHGYQADHAAGGLEVADDCDGQAVDLANYKGIYAAGEGEDGDGEQQVKYTCPQTGAHFEISDLSRRLKKVLDRRQRTES